MFRGGGIGIGNGLAPRYGSSNGPGGGTSVTRIPCGGEFSNRLAIALIIEESRKMPYAPRMLVLAPNGDQAKPILGAKFQIAALTPPCGTPGSPGETRPSGALGYTVLFWPA